MEAFRNQTLLAVAYTVQCTLIEVVKAAAVAAAATLVVVLSLDTLSHLKPSKF